MLAAVVLPATAGSHETGFLNRTVTVGGTTYRYVVYVPADWTSDKTWPIILFLHGAGERGDGGLAQSNIGLPSSIRKYPDRFPAVVVMPQCRTGRWWPEPEMEAQALAALDAATKEFNGDPQRTYLTGLSMGGYGSWDLASKYPERFAAVAVVCGGVRLPPNLARLRGTAQPVDEDPYEPVAKKVAAMPIWVFHGGADPIVPVSESQNMVKALKLLNADVRYTEYPGVGHNSWEKAYDEPEFPVWLLGQKLKGAPKTTAP